MSYDLPMNPHLRMVGDVGQEIFRAAVLVAQAAARAGLATDAAEPERGRVLHPGVETPLWNELVRRVEPHLVRRGSKAQLARLLGVPRQRLQDCLRERSAMLDGERTLLLLCWVAARERGEELGTPPLGSL